MAKRGRKRGRKRGSPNREYVQTHAIAATCVKCGSGKIKSVGSPPIVKAIVGTLRDGTRYTSIKWTRSQCECGQYLNVKTYLAQNKIATGNNSLNGKAHSE